MASFGITKLNGPSADALTPTINGEPARVFDTKPVLGAVGVDFVATGHGLSAVLEEPIVDIDLHPTPMSLGHSDIVYFQVVK